MLSCKSWSNDWDMYLLKTERWLNLESNFSMPLINWLAQQSQMVDFKEDEVWALCISNPFNIGQNFSQKIEGKE